MSESTLPRKICSTTGIRISVLRHQLRVADDLGYGDSTAFIMMFKQAVAQLLASSSNFDSS